MNKSQIDINSNCNFLFSSIKRLLNTKPSLKNSGLFSLKKYTSYPFSIKYNIDFLYFSKDEFRKGIFFKFLNCNIQIFFFFIFYIFIIFTYKT